MVLLLIVGYAPSVFAAEVMMGPLDIPLVKYGYVALMGTWGSVASLLQKFAKGTTKSNWRMTAATDIVNANLAAMLVFLACEHYKAPAALTAIAYTLGGYGGARTMEWLYKRFIGTGEALIDKQLGITTAPVPVEPLDIPTATTPKEATQ